MLPPADAYTLHGAIPNSVMDSQGNFAFPCNTNAVVSVIFQGRSFTISPEDYVGTEAYAGSDLCNSNIVGGNVGGSTTWLLGDVFLKNVFTHTPTYPFAAL